MSYNYDFLKGSHLGKFIDILEEQYKFYHLDLQRRYINSIDNKTFPYLKIIDVAFRFSDITNLVNSGDKLIASFGRTVVYEGFCDLLESIFLSREGNVISVNILGDLDIILTNNNARLLAKYIGDNSASYVDINSSQYIGFKSGEWSSLGVFLKNFLEKFLPVNRKINSFEILSSVSKVCQ